MSGPTPWAGWLRLGLGRLRLPPEAFWSLSLREWSLALEGWREATCGRAVTPLTRGELWRLVEQDCTQRK